MNRFSPIVMVLFLVWVPAVAEQPQAPADSPFAAFTRDWRDDPVWRDGSAELAVYDARRTIDGQSVQYQARLRTNTEWADPQTKTRSRTNDGRHVFRHHLRESIADANDQPVHISIMVFVGTSDLKSLKLEVGLLDADGATFKQYVNHAGQCQWHQFSYLPGEGYRSGGFAPPSSFAWLHALSLLLRGYPFDDLAALDKPVRLALLEDQASRGLSASEPRAFLLRYAGRETLDLPIKKVETHHLVVWPEEPRDDEDQARHYWFAVEAGPPWLHVMVRHDAPGGLSYRLAELHRDPLLSP